MPLYYHTIAVFIDTIPQTQYGYSKFFTYKITNYGLIYTLKYSTSQ